MVIVPGKGRRGGPCEVARDQQRGRSTAVADRAPDVGLGGDVAARADRAALGPGHVAAGDQRGRLHRSRHRPRGDPQLQPRRLRRALPALQGRTAADVHAAQAPGDQADRAHGPAEPRPAVCDLEPGQAGRLPGRRGGGHRHLPRRTTCAAARGRRPLSSREDLEAFKRPELRGQTRPDRRALRARRQAPGGRDLPRRVRPAEPAAPAWRLQLGTARQSHAGSARPTTAHTASAI